MAGASQPSDVDGRATPAQGARGPGLPWGGPEYVPTSLPTWLLKELQRAGVPDETINGLDEEAARDLIAEIRSDAIE